VSHELAYAELVCASHFSFLKASGYPEDLVARAHALGYHALALTDEASVSGSVRAHLAAQSLGFHLIHGARFIVNAHLGQPLDLVFLVKNRTGWQQLCGLITQARTRAPKGSYWLDAQMLQAISLDHCLAIWLPSLALSDQPLHSQGRWLKTLFADQLIIGCSQHLHIDDRIWQQQLMGLSALLHTPIAAVGDVRMHRRRDKPLLDLLTAIRHGKTIAQCGRLLTANAEQYLRPRLRIARHFPIAFLQQTLQIASQCQFSLDELRYEYPDEIVPPGLSPGQWLRHLTEQGASQRYPIHQYPQGMPAAVRQQIEHELTLIAELRYEPYFLTVYDIVAFARSRGILCQGRGSAANSAVCYCLGITEVDPSRMSMLFERFISKERQEPPDIDVDFEHHRREEVIQYLYEKYGRHRAALAAAIIRYRPRSALRDVGKALGLDPELVDQAAKGRSWWDGRQIQAEGLPATALSDRWADLTNRIMGFPRHLSQHVGGFVIARRQLSDLVPIENAAMQARSIIQWDKDDIDALGLLKVDVLALGMLSAIQKALQLVGQKTGQGPLPMQDIPPEDPQTYDMICAADTIGVFQIESRAQMSMLPRLKPRCFYDLVIEVAIIRPGPIQGGMVHPYLQRRQGLEPIDYPSPEVEQALSRTLGVPIFQEQVMQLAILAAGFSPGEADQLRRAMAAWRKRGSLGPFQDKLVQGMLARGYDESFAQRVFAQIQGFGEYGFPESHAASFALLVYVSCWLKCHHPDAFCAALLNSQPMGFYAPSQLIQDAQRHGVTVEPVDVIHSNEQTSLVGPMQIRLGLQLVAGLSQPGLQRLLIARQQRPFTSVNDLAKRAELQTTDLRALAHADALRGLSGHRHQAMWQASGAAPLKSLLQTTEVMESALAPQQLPSPSVVQDVLQDYASLGLSLRAHPLSFLRETLIQRFRSQTIQVLKAMPSGRLARASGLVTHRQRPGTAKGTVFLSIEDETGGLNVIVWPKVLDQYKPAVLRGQLLTVYGTWQRDDRIDPQDPGQVHHLLAVRIEDHTALLTQVLGQAIAQSSRDFH
jgi:error-prone DNA polymerase